MGAAAANSGLGGPWAGCRLLKSSLGGVGDPGAAEEAPDQVVWVKFDVNGLAPDVCGHPPQAGHLPLLLIGYANGIQVASPDQSPSPLPLQSRFVIAVVVFRVAVSWPLRSIGAESAL